MTAEHDLTGVELDDRYRVVRLMGQGGMGQVYEGVHDYLARRVAIKVLMPRLAVEGKYRERFLREAKAASKIHHPGVVEILDFGDTPTGSVYFVMEFLEGHDLKQLLQGSGALPWPRARHLLLQILAALEAAHEQRIIHRDIKPANCFVVATKDDPETVKLLDFGIAKVTAEAGEGTNSLANSLTNTGEVFGTVKYMAPEVATGVSDDPRSDMYSLGVMAYEMLAGQVPFSGPFAFQIISRHVNEPPKPPRQFVPSIPPQVEAFILRALAKQPEHRFASMREMRKALAAIPADVRGSTVAVPTGPAVVVGGVPGGTVQMDGPTEVFGGAEASGSQGGSATVVSGPVESSASRPVATPSRAPWIVAVGVLVLLAVGGVVGLLVLRWDDRAQKGETPEVPSVAKASVQTDVNNEPEEPPPDEAASGSATGSSSASTSGATSETGLETTTGEADTSGGEDATTPAPSSRSSRRSNKRRTPKIVSDDGVKSRTRRSIEKRCAAVGEGESVTIELLVGSTGKVLNSRVKGAKSVTFEQCALGEVRKAKFPEGQTRRISLRASL